MPKPRRLVGRILTGLLGVLFCVLLWRAFSGRPGGNFPALGEIPVLRLDQKPVDTRVRPGLRAEVDAARAAQGRAAEFGFLIDLVEQVDFDLLSKLLDGRPQAQDKQLRRNAFLQALRLLAEDRQAPLREALEQMRARGRIVRHDGLRIVNRIAVVARDPGVVDELAARPDVAELVEQHLFHPPADPGATAQPMPRSALDDRRPPGGSADPLCWAIDALGAPAAWQQGLDGRGVVVGLLDTGARHDHDQLRDNWRGARDPSRADDSWYHPSDAASKKPVETSFHGTGVLSAAVGLNRPRRDGSQTRIGVAPGASWVAAAAYVEDTVDFILLSASADWMLFHARPDVLVHTRTFPPATVDPRLARIFSAFKIAETVVVFAAGNQGPTRGLNLPPANFPKLSPFAVPAFSVGASSRDGAVAALSARGPNADGGGVFPQLVAPGHDLTVAFSVSPHVLMSTEGTSVAAGYAAGAAAILLQAAPTLHPNDIERLLKSSARPIGDRRPNYDAGHGQIDLVAALAQLRASQRATPTR